MEEIDILREKIYIHSATIEGALALMNQYGGDEKVANGLYCSFRELIEAIDDMVEKETGNKLM